ncbi:MAG: hypothetical protein IKO62_06095 [Bacteroidales bacterium]|nr:hypothetical protein [Bacteroidales bacterium]
MSILIENLQIGCTGAQLVAKINEIISALNGVEQTTDYEALTNKPSINGVTLLGNKTTGNLMFELADAGDYSTLIATLATKAELTAAGTNIIDLASEAVKSELASRIPMDYSEVNESTMINDAAYIYVLSKEGLRKVSIANLCNNVALKTVSSSTLEKAVQSQLVMLEVSGEQNGENVNFKVDRAYIYGTSHLFLNGQRLVSGSDYIEDKVGFAMLTHAPEQSDSLVFITATK